MVFFSINRSSKSKYLMSVNYCCVYFFLIQSYSLFKFIHGIGQDQFVCCLQHLRLLIIFLQFKTEQVYNYFGNRRHCEPVQLKACNALFIWVSWVILYLSDVRDKSLSRLDLIVCNCQLLAFSVTSEAWFFFFFCCVLWGR